MSNNKTEQLYAQRNNSTAQTPVHTLTKYATLSPYLAEIQKRKKAKSILKQNRNKSKNQSSSKSFRIKQRSSSSLQSNSKREINNKAILNIISKVNARKKQQQNNSKQLIINSKQTLYNPASTYTIKSSVSRTNSRTDAVDVRSKEKDRFKSNYDKDIQHRDAKKKQMSFRRNKFQSKSRNQNTIELNDKMKDTIQVSKYGYTDTNRTNKQQPAAVKKTENMYAAAVGRKNFRKGKYEALYSSVNSNQIQTSTHIQQQPTKSQSRLQISKKQSVLSMNKIIDNAAEKQMENLYRNIKSKQIRKSLQKSTQKYFKQDSTYRAPKTNNDIEIYVSTVKNPSVNRQSNASTLNTSDKQQDSSSQAYVSSLQKRKENNFLNYDFEFKDPQQHQIFSGITEIDNPSEEESINFMQESDFEKQRKQVQRQYFNKKSPQVQWSQQDCQIDQL